MNEYQTQIHLFRIRLGMIEEEREEDERKLNVALAAAERVNVLVSDRKDFQHFRYWPKLLMQIFINER